VTKPAPRRKAAKRVEPAPVTSAPPYDPRAWNSGVRGRIIQLGAFRTSAQANGEWNRVYYRYPLLRPLPPRVLKTKIRGRTYYRLQLGTFSQAHSELLCQRLRATGEGCIVLGLRGRR
jgi:cell division protein FtsN